MQTHSVTVKIATISVVGAACFVVSLLVLGLVSERQIRHMEVQDEVGKTWGAPQTVVGPLLVFSKPPLPDTTTPVEQYVLPRTLTIESDIMPEVRSRGMYDVVVYTQTLTVSGTFASADAPGIPNRSTPTLVVALSDTRSIEKQLTLDWNGHAVPFEPGPHTELFDGAGIHATVPYSTSVAEYPFSFTLTIKGTKEALFVPVGKETTVIATSPWHTPTFIGAFLPTDRTVDDRGFTASWHVSSFGRNYPQSWEGRSVVSALTLQESAFGVGFLEGVDLYTQLDRSVKYAILFIVVTFATLFLFEILRKVRVHPIQYLLIGAALALFYLLLLSLAEHIGFLFAYVLATGMITLLITGYSMRVLTQKKHAFTVGGILLALYAYLYFILKLEDYALLFGALLLFVLLAGMMYLTRAVDWFAVGDSDGGK